MRLTLRIYAPLIGYAQGEKGVFGNTNRWRKSVEAGLAARTRLITGTKQGTTGKPALEKRS